MALKPTAKQLNDLLQLANAFEVDGRAMSEYRLAAFDNHTHEDVIVLEVFHESTEDEPDAEICVRELLAATISEDGTELELIVDGEEMSLCLMKTQQINIADFFKPDEDN